MVKLKLGMVELDLRKIMICVSYVEEDEAGIRVM